MEASQAIIVRPLMNTAQRHPVVTGAWLIGLCLLIFASGIPLTPRQEADFKHAVGQIDFAGLDEARMEVESAEYHYRESKGWFFSCDALCTRNHAILKEKQAHFDKLKAEADAKLSTAKSKLGVFSEVAVDQARSILYRNVGAGKDFAKRTTLWDAFFLSMGRNESLMEYLLRLLLHALMNLFMGLVGACTSFLWGVSSVITSFQPSLIEGILFFLGCICVVVSIFVSFGLAIYIAGATAVVSTTRMIESSQNQQQQHHHPRSLR